MRILSVTSGGFRTAAYSPDGSRLATGHPGRVRLWDARTGEELAWGRTMMQGPGGVTQNDLGSPDGLAYSDDGRFIAAGGYVGAVMLWEVVETDGKPAMVKRGSETGSLDDQADVVGVGDCVRMRASDRYIRWWGMTFREGGYTLMIEDYPNSIIGLDLEAGREVRRTFGVTWARLSRDGRFFTRAAGKDRTEVRRCSEIAFDTGDGTAFRPEGAAVGTIPERIDYVNAVRFSADGSRVAVLRGPHVSVWDTAAGSEVMSQRVKGKWSIFMELSPDGRTVLLGGKEKDIAIWDVDAGHERARYEPGVGQIYTLRFAPDGLTVAVGGSSKKLAIWDVE